MNYKIPIAAMLALSGTLFPNYSSAQEYNYFPYWEYNSHIQQRDIHVVHENSCLGLVDCNCEQTEPCPTKQKEVQQTYAVSTNRFTITLSSNGTLIAMNTSDGQLWSFDENKNSWNKMGKPILNIGN